MKKRAQANQVFTYIFVLLVVVLILFFGYKGITALINQGEDVQMEQFKKLLKQDIESTSQSYGSVRQLSYNVPSSVTEVCFYDGSLYCDAYSPPICPETAKCITAFKYALSSYPLIEDAKDTANIFIRTSEGMNTLNLPKMIDVGCNDIICVPASNGVVNLYAMGKGGSSFIFYPDLEICDKIVTDHPNNCKNMFGFIEVGEEAPGSGYYKEACCKEHGKCCN